MNVRSALFIGLAALLFAAGCDSVSSSEFQEDVVVEGYLLAGAPLTPVRVSRTVALNGKYDESEQAVYDAGVSIHLLNAEGAIEESYRYARYSSEPGRYLPIDRDARVMPRRKYELEVTVPDRDLPITSVTLVPDTFSVVYINTDTVTYQADPQLNFHITNPPYPGRQNVYVFTTIALDGHEDQLTPFARALFDSGDDVTLEDLRSRASPLLNEDNFEHINDQLLGLRFPWLAIFFYGRNEVRIRAIDDNLRDFIRSQSIQQGGSTLPPGEIPNVLEHVEGGRGIFGSYGSVTIDVYVNRPNDSG